MSRGFSPPDITEREIEAVAEVLRSGWITTGPRTKRFEAELSAFAGTPRTAALSSATAALQSALELLGIGPGDEVITSAYTYTASCSVICHVGATPVLVDTAPDSYEMSCERLAEALTSRTKAVIAVDLAGIMCDYDSIFAALDASKADFCPKPGSLQEALGRPAVIADAAHSLGARRGGVSSGAAADLTAFSFHAVKNVTTGEGGALTWRSSPCISDDELYKQLMLLSLHGQSKDAFAKDALGSWEYDIVAPLHKRNMTDILAAIGCVQLERYPGLLERRHQLAAMYGELLGDDEAGGMPLELPRHVGEGFRSSAHLYMLRLLGKGSEFRNELIRGLARRDVPANVHYKPLPLLSAYRALGFKPEDFPNALARYANEVTLPLHTLLTETDVAQAAEAFRESYEEAARLLG